MSERGNTLFLSGIGGLFALSLASLVVLMVVETFRPNEPVAGVVLGKTAGNGGWFSERFSTDIQVADGVVIEEPSASCFYALEPGDTVSGEYDPTYLRDHHGAYDWECRP